MLKRASHHTYLFVAILLIAALLRLQQINQPFIDATSWRQTDNATIADNYYRGNGNIFYPQISWNGPEPNYVGYEFQTITYLAGLLYHIFGHHEWIGRSIAVLFSLWGLFAFYQLVRRLWTANHALLSAAILAIMPGQAYVDRSFLADPVMLSLVITSFWLLVLYLRTEQLRYLILASIIGMWGFLTKISGAIIGLPMLYAVIIILKQKQQIDFRQFTRLAIAATSTLIPVIAYYLWAIHISRTYPPYYIAAGQYWVWNFGLSFFLEQHYFVSKLYHHLNWFWTKPLMALVLLGLFLSAFQRKDNTTSQKATHQTIIKAPWVFHWWIGAFALYYLVAAQGLVNNPTNLNLMNPAAAALTANLLMMGASFIERKINARISLALTVTILLFIALKGYKERAVVFYPWGAKEYRMGLALRQLSRPGDLVVTATTTVGSTVANYYSQRFGWVFPPLYSWTSLNMYDIDAPTAIKLLEELSTKGARWLGVEYEQRLQIAKNKPLLDVYLKTKLVRYYENPDFIIYQIPSKN